VFEKRAKIKYKSINENPNNTMFFKNLKSCEKKVKISKNNVFKAMIF
jgi:hypothetical protein